MQQSHLGAAMKMLRALVAGLIVCGTLSFTTDAQTSALARPVLVIRSTPGGAQVYVDDELVGTTSPEGQLKISTLKPGKHTLRLSLDGHSYGQGPFSLVAGKSLTKTVALTQQNAAAGATPLPTASPTPPSGPSMQGTAQWITTKLLLTGYTNDYTGGTGTAAITAKSASITNCILSYSTHFEDHFVKSEVSFAGRTQRDQIETVPLGAITTVVAQGAPPLGIAVGVHLSSQVHIENITNAKETDRIDPGT
jgi:hypothetical protein